MSLIIGLESNLTFHYSSWAHGREWCVPRSARFELKNSGLSESRFYKRMEISGAEERHEDGCVFLGSRGDGENASLFLAASCC